MIRLEGDSRGISSAQIRHPDRGILAPNHISSLILIAQGNTYPEVAKLRGVSVQQIKNVANELRGRLGVSTMPEAIERAADLGVIDLRAMVSSGFDPSVFSSFGESDRVVIDGISKGKPYKEISAELGVSESMVKNRAASIAKLIGAKGSSHMATHFFFAKQVKKEEAIVRGEDPSRVDVFGPLQEVSHAKKGLIEIDKKLSPREKSALELAGKGFSEKGIGGILGLSKNTVKQYLAHARARFGVGTTRGLLVEAINLGMINVEFAISQGIEAEALGELDMAERKILSSLMIDKPMVDLVKELGMSYSDFDKALIIVLGKIKALNPAQAVVMLLKIKKEGYIEDGKFEGFTFNHHVKVNEVA
ncbi:MAG: hypothetical protein KBD51_01055 [Candidatus Levybacteria bacterium]|nr:hypothetical protein [Candidatus Levybacteria bacterium]